ncbi:PREDICTED: uncharacterized protein LOC107332195 [Acropora digitifera]|uniref:uncharacterized protein LOC107332195 n=1 Tax=Acropora digitifera TaxID=70779 RepID=UPI00077AE0F9|nr:PREDICTED: uncharacterized protein LOC107332195 [Acropora digitifera]
MSPIYINDHHNGQLQVSLDEGEYGSLVTADERNLAAATSAIFLVAYNLVQLGYFLGLSKSILTPVKIVPYLGFMGDSSRETFHLIPEKKGKFIALIQKLLESSYVSVKTLQHLVGKCVSFARAVPAAKLFTREMNAAISRGLRSQKPILLHDALREEISHWLFLENRDNPILWHDERHIQISVATDASFSGWGATVVSPNRRELLDYWTQEEFTWDIATKEAMAINKMLLSCSDEVRSTRVDVQVDNQAVIHAWNNQGGRSPQLNNTMKVLFSTTAALNVLLHLVYVPFADNPADSPSRHRSSTDFCLTDRMWRKIQREFGGFMGHTFDLISLDSNVPKDCFGNSLPHFTPVPSPGSAGVNFFAQDLTTFGPLMQCPYIFPPPVLVFPVLSYLRSMKQACTIAVLDSYPRKYWWPLLHHYAKKAVKIASTGDGDLLLIPSAQGWIPHSGIPGDLWVFSVVFR